jgi:hypothetical protein
LSYSRAPQKLPKKEFELFEHPARGYKLREFSNSRQDRGVPFQGINSGNYAESGANDWCPFFWFFFFGQAKKMNRYNQCSLDLFDLSRSITCYGLAITKKLIAAQAPDHTPGPGEIKKIPGPM